MDTEHDSKLTQTHAAHWCPDSVSYSSTSGMNNNTIDSTGFIAALFCVQQQSPLISEFTSDGAEQDCVYYTTTQL